MPLTVRFQNTMTAVFAPPDIGLQLIALPLHTEAGTVIQTESSQDISVESGPGAVWFMIAGL